MQRHAFQHALRTLLPLLLVTVLAACRQPTVSAPAPAQAAEALGEAISAAELVGTNWQAVAFGSPGDSQPIDQATPVTLNFGVDRYFGTGGCNWFLGVYDVADDQMELRAPAQTVLQCKTPANLMQQEAMYLSALWNIVAYRQLDEKLLAYATDNQLLLTFVPAAPVALEGTAWSLKFQQEDEQMAPIIADTAITATFAAGRISGNAGCNTYEAAYTLDGDALAINGLSATEKACDAPEGVMDREQLYLANLASATQLTQSGGLLQLLNADDETVLAFGAP